MANAVQSMGYKQKILTLADIFLHMTDEEHPMTAGELCEEMMSRGVKSERKAVYDDIYVLIDAGMDIVKTRSPKRGYFLASRVFEIAELRMLMDAVQSAAFLTPQKTRRLTRKLMSLTSIYQAKEMERQCCWKDGIKCSNEEIYYNIDLLQCAIAQQKKIEFSYYHQGTRRELPVKRRLVSPYGLVWWDNRYYCVGNYDKYENLSHYRIDRMRAVAVSEQPARPFSNLEFGEQQFDIADYMKRTVNMFSGHTDDVILRFAPSLDEAMMDQFGTRTQFRKCYGGWYRMKIPLNVSEGLVAWIMQFGPQMEVIAPKSLREEVHRRVERMGQIYGNTTIER
ncbi:MAG: WYL domain-containing protein [Clostridiales bacterium]|nr:WYL domain-containing protein [Clostridiales bacterium]